MGTPAEVTDRIGELVAQGFSSFVFLTHGLLVTKAAAVMFVVLLGTVFLLRRRRSSAAVDF